MNVARLIRPSLRAARVIYFSDMTRTGSRMIPLGVFCEIKHPHAHGLGLKARSALTDGERALVAAVLREALSNPFKYLAGEFDIAWAEADPSQSLDFLARRHASALSILAPYMPVVERSWHLGIFGEPDVDAKLKAALNQEFDALLAEVPLGDAPTDEPPVVRLQMAA